VILYFVAVLEIKVFSLLVKANRSTKVGWDPDRISRN